MQTARSALTAAFKKRLRQVIRAGLDRQSINRYLAVFGAVPKQRPARQWLCEGRDTYIHIADVWKDPELRQRILERLWRRRAYKLLLCLARPRRSRHLRRAAETEAA